MRRCYTRVTALGRVVPASTAAAVLRRDFILKLLHDAAVACGGREAWLPLQSIANVAGLSPTDVYSICALACSDGLVAFSGPDAARAVALTEAGGVYIETLPGMAFDDD